MVKNLPLMQETWVWSMGQEDPLEKGMATHSTILFHYSPGFYPENPMDRRAWWATVHGVTKSQTGLKTKHIGLNIPEADFLKNLSNCTSLLYWACGKCGRSSCCSWAHCRPWVKAWEQSVHGLCPPAVYSLGPKRSNKDSNVIKNYSKVLRSKRKEKNISN